MWLQSVVRHTAQTGSHRGGPHSEERCPCPNTLAFEHLDQDAWLDASGHVCILLLGVLLHTLFGDDFHDVDGLFPGLLDGSVHELLSDAIGHSAMRTTLGHLSNFLANLWKWHVNDLLHCAILHPLLWNVLHNIDSFAHHMRNRDVIDLFSGALDTRISVGKLILVVITFLWPRMWWAKTLLSSSVWPKFFRQYAFLPSSSPWHPWAKSPSDPSSRWPLSATEINFKLTEELLRIQEDWRSSSIARLATAMVLATDGLVRVALNSSSVSSLFMDSIVSWMAKSSSVLLFPCSSYSDDWLSKFSASSAANVSCQIKTWRLMRVCTKCPTVRKGVTHSWTKFWCPVQRGGLVSVGLFGPTQNCPVQMITSSNRRLSPQAWCTAKKSPQESDTLCRVTCDAIFSEASSSSSFCFGVSWSSILGVSLSVSLAASFGPPSAPPWASSFGTACSSVAATWVSQDNGTNDRPEDNQFETVFHYNLAIIVQIQSRNPPSAHWTFAKKVSMTEPSRSKACSDVFPTEGSASVTTSELSALLVFFEEEPHGIGLSPSQDHRHATSKQFFLNLSFVAAETCSGFGWSFGAWKHFTIPDPIDRKAPMQKNFLRHWRLGEGKLPSKASE